jgi:formylglycine-generating enzyme required for sulfatase activity
MGGTGGEEGRPEFPVHQVRIAHDFALGMREVSNAEYARFISESGYAASKGCRSFNPQTKSVDVNPAADFRAPGLGAGDGQPNLPAVCVSWTDAKAYVAWLSRKTGKAYRLPSEAEWEYAARAGSQTDYPWGDNAADGCGVANVYDLDGAAKGVMAVFQQQPAAGPEAGGAPTPPANAACRDGFAGAAPVGSFKANSFGLHDMIGNVWEWTQDCYVAPYPAAVPVDGRPLELSGPCPRRAVRGGSWITVPFRNRPAWRGRDPETLVSWIFGFRVARDLGASDGHATGRNLK